MILGVSVVLGVAVVVLVPVEGEPEGQMCSYCGGTPFRRNPCLLLAGPPSHVALGRLGGRHRGQPVALRGQGGSFLLGNLLVGPAVLSGHPVGAVEGPAVCRPGAKLYPSLASDLLLSTCCSHCHSSPGMPPHTNWPGLQGQQQLLLPGAGQAQASWPGADLQSQGRALGRKPSSPQHLVCVQSPVVGGGDVVVGGTARGGVVRSTALLRPFGSLQVCPQGLSRSCSRGRGPSGREPPQRCLGAGSPSSSPPSTTPSPGQWAWQGVEGPVRALHPQGSCRHVQCPLREALQATCAEFPGDFCSALTHRAGWRGLGLSWDWGLGSCCLERGGEAERGPVISLSVPSI